MIVPIYFAVVDHMGVIHVGEAFSEKVLKEIDTGVAPVAIQIYPNQKSIFVITKQDGVHAYSFNGHGKKFQEAVNPDYTCLDFTSAGSHLLLGRSCGAVELWELSGNRKPRGKSMLVNSGQVNVVRWATNSFTFFSGGTEQLVYRWAGGGSGIELQCCEGHRSEITGIFSCKNPLLAVTCAGMNDGTAKLWQLDTGACIFSTQPGKPGINAIVFDEDRNLLYYARQDGTLERCDIKTGKTQSYLIGGKYVSHMWLHSAGKYLLCAEVQFDWEGNDSGRLSLWNVDSGDQLSSISFVGEIIDLDVFRGSPILSS
jgi:WD40 repeat protein